MFRNTVSNSLYRTYARSSRSSFHSCMPKHQRMSYEELYSFHHYMFVTLSWKSLKSSFAFWRSGGEQSWLPPYWRAGQQRPGSDKRLQVTASRTFSNFVCVVYSIKRRPEWTSSLFHHSKWVAHSACVKRNWNRGRGRFSGIASVTKGANHRWTWGCARATAESACPIAGGVMRRDDSGLTIAGWGIWRDQGGSKAPHMYIRHFHP